MANELLSYIFSSSFHCRPASRKLSDISSILDPKSVSEALKRDQGLADLENKENISVINGKA